MLHTSGCCLPSGAAGCLVVTLRSLLPARPLLAVQDERARKYAQEVQSLQFNVLVTTYEFIMRDRTRLSKVPAALLRPFAMPSAPSAAAAVAAGCHGLLACKFLAALASVPS